MTEPRTSVDRRDERGLAPLQRAQDWSSNSSGPHSRDDCTAIEAGLPGHL
ncbi:hypothetical protein [Streptomyces sp. NPDC102360]